MKPSALKRPGETIHFFITGGTIDSYYNGAKDIVEPLRESAIPQYVRSLKLAVYTVFTTICLKDSRSITSDDRATLVEAIRQSPHRRIIVTHGTYTMPDTARYLKVHLGKDGKMIVLTGSFIPLVGFTPSDAPFNLGYAVASVLGAKAGIKVCMNGRAFDPTEVRKLQDEGRFDSTRNPSPPVSIGGDL